MNLTKHVVVAATVATLGIAASAVDAAPIVSNPSFEAPVDGFTDWITFGEGWRIGGPGDANSGIAGAVNDVLPGATSDAFRGVAQVLDDGFSVGDTYTASAFLAAAANEASESFVQLKYLDAAGGTLLSVQSPAVTSDQPFMQMTTPEAVVPFGTEAIEISGVVFIPAGATFNDTDFLIFDDFSISVVPEPTSAAAGLVALLGMATRRRR